LQTARRSFSDGSERRLQAELDVLLRRLHVQSRKLLGATTHSDPAERERLASVVARGGHAKPRWQWRPLPVDPAAWRELDRARLLSEGSVAPGLYLDRLEELETELLLLESLGITKRVRPMAARLYGTGSEPVDGDPTVTLLDAAHDILSTTTDDAEAKTVPAVCPKGKGLSALMLAYAEAVGIHIAIRVDSGLIANAAVGERTVFIADRRFGAREAKRLATHEVLGHLVSAFNGRTQLLGIFGVGTAGSYGDQEGVSIYLEELAGLLDASRRRTLAGRLLATHAMHSGVTFGDAARALTFEHGFTSVDAVTLCERSYRGGGVARDAVYLGGWLKVRAALLQGRATIEELQSGKTSLSALPEQRRLRDEAIVSRPVYLSNLARSLGRTGAGTRSATSPPSLATSLTRLDAT